MKLYISLILTILCINLFGQQPQNPQEIKFKNEISVGIFQFFGGTLDVNYEHYLKPSTSMVISGDITMISSSNSEDVLGGKGEFQYRYYVAPFILSTGSLKLEGVYVGPYVFYNYTNVLNHNYYDNSSGLTYERNFYYSTYSGGFIGGVKFSLIKHFSIDIYFGGGLKITKTNDKENNNGIYDRGYSGISPRINCTFGLRF
ncbi:MAG: DUF3575 domain-containing protein [Bacteroidia bacterium]|nr:DUF3575 domain-containing protein [Bacteroidia bacterium]